MIQDIGCLLHYLPPYSLDFNPIKSAFSKVKLELQQSELERYNTTYTDILLLQPFTSITPDNCTNWIYETSKDTLWCTPFNYSTGMHVFFIDISMEVYVVMTECFLFTQKPLICKNTIICKYCNCMLKMLHPQFHRWDGWWLQGNMIMRNRFWWIIFDTALANTTAAPSIASVNESFLAFLATLFENNGTSCVKLSAPHFLFKRVSLPSHQKDIYIYISLLKLLYIILKSSINTSQILDCCFPS